MATGEVYWPVFRSHLLLGLCGCHPPEATLLKSKGSAWHRGVHGIHLREKQSTMLLTTVFLLIRMTASNFCAACPAVWTLLLQCGLDTITGTCLSPVL